MKRILLYFKEYENPSLKLADVLSISAESINVHHFPDGESLIRLPERLPSDCIICRSLFRPNEKLIELLLAARAARELCAGEITLVAPYLCYMRQDMAFHPGEAISQKIIGQLLAELFDAVITVDAHLHRISSLSQVMPGCRAVNLSASRVLSDVLMGRRDKPILLGPDEESLQWVKTIAENSALEYGVCKKKRLGDRDVKIILPNLDFSEKTVVIVDDIISTGKTVSEVSNILRSEGANKIECLITHPIFAEGAINLLKKNGIDKIISTDSIPHETNEIELAPVLASAFQ